MKNISILFFFFCLIITDLFVSAQNPFTFTNANSKFTSATFHSGNCVSVVDMDGDGMDDIARLSQGTDAYYTIQQTGTTFNNVHAVASGLGAAWGMVVGDVDNNGVRDIAIGSGSAVRLVKGNATATTFTLSASLPAPGTFFPQNMNFSDIDNDGSIDLFVCNDDAAGVFWKNVSGAYPAMTSFFSVANPGTDNSGNYGSIFTDLDNDGDIDFYIAHCRQGTGATDARRLDQLFINNGNGTYTLDAAAAPGARGLRNYAMTWTASFDDIDNDGDLDCVLTETDVASKLLLNDGNGYFTEITTGSGFVVDVTPYQSKMEDLDNDGYIDIIISGDDSRIFHNNHNNTFTRIDNLFDSNNMLSFATGDLNHDGKIDLYTSYGSVYNSPTSTNDVLWMNTTNNANHFVTFDLQGTVSNRDALGARVEVYGAWGKQIREVRAGESYGTTNSFMCHFGLGTATMVDSAIIRWPKGLVTRLYNRPADQFIKVIEGQCSSPDNIIAYNGPSALCAGQSVTLTATPGYSYLWSNGAITQAITTSVTGDFTVKVIDSGTGCSSISRMATIVSQPDETPTISAAGPTTFCEGQGVTLNGTFATGGYVWRKDTSTVANTQNFTATQAGTYSLTIHGTCADFTSQTITVSPITSHVSNVVEASTCENNLTALTLQATGTGDTYWYDAPTGGNLVATGISYTTPPISNTATYYVESRDTVPGLEGNVGPVDNNFGTGGIYNGSGRYEIFDVFKSCILRTVKVYAGAAGNRIVELRNSAGALLNSTTINMPSGESTVTLNFALVPGTNYRLGWSGSTPDLYRNNSGASYPYIIPNLISVTGSQAGSAFWYAYYNWQVEEQPVACASIRTPVVAAVNPIPTAAITPSGATSFCDGGSVTLTADANTSYLWSDNSTSQSLNVTQGGNYSVTVTSADNCANSSSISITEFATPDAAVTTDKPTTICPGDNVTLTAPAGLTYSWSNNATTESITVSANGTFTVTVTDNNSCSAESTPITVAVSNNAVAGITSSGVTTFCEGGSVDLTASAGTSYQWSNNATTANITVNASGTFTVTVTSGSCTAVSSPVNVVVNPNPSAPTVTPSGATTFCEGGSVDLSTGAASSYLWSNSSTLSTITVNQSGSFSVEITDANGCSSTSTTTVVTVNPNPTVSMSGLGAQYFNNDALVALSGTPSGGTFSGTGVSGNTFDPSIAGVGGPYTVTYNYTDGNGCSASASSDVTVLLATSAYQIEGISAVNIFPNPSEGEFQLSLKSNGSKKIDVEISNYIGEKVFEEKNISVNNTFTKQITLKDVAKGFYNLTVTSGKKRNTYKVVIQ